jgi:hypothetical protein
MGLQFGRSENKALIQRNTAAQDRVRAYKKLCSIRGLLTQQRLAFHLELKYYDAFKNTHRKGSYFGLSSCGLSKAASSL